MRPTLRHAAAPILALALCALALPGCEWLFETNTRDGVVTGEVHLSRPLAPVPEVNPPAPNADVYPLVLGSSWDYFLVTRIWVDDMSGPPVEVLEGRERRVMTRMETLFDHEYTVETRTPLGGFGSSFREVYFRQDRTGLHEAELAIRWTPADQLEAEAEALAARVMEAVSRARPDDASRYAGVVRNLAERVVQLRGAPASGGGLSTAPPELVRLRYPLRPKQTWAVRTTPFWYTSTAERMLPVAVPAGTFSAWQIRNRSELFGPRDVVHTWFGREGQLGMRAHVEQEETDPQGNPVHAIYEFSEMLTRVYIPGRFGAPYLEEPVATR